MSAYMVDMVAAVFDQMHPLFGLPTLRIYGPVSSWTLGSGVTYEPITDTFVDEDGNPTTQAYGGQSYTSADYVPSSGQESTFAVSVPGATEVRALSVVVRYTSGVETALDSAWAVEVPAQSGKVYRIASRQYAPQGATTPSLIQLELTERGS